jgi:hypothetical protein
MSGQNEIAKVKRINRRLEKDSRSGSVMKVSRARSERMRLEFGDYYMVEVYHNVLVEKDVDIHALAKKLGV